MPSVGHNDFSSPLEHVGSLRSRQLHSRAGDPWRVSPVPCDGITRGIATSIPRGLGTRHQHAGSVSTQRHSDAHTRCHQLPGACIWDRGVSLLSSCPSQLIPHLGGTGKGSYCLSSNPSCLGSMGIHCPGHRDTKELPAAPAHLHQQTAATISAEIPATVHTTISPAEVERTARDSR